MNIWKDVADAVRLGHKVHIEFLKGIAEQEGYLEIGMRGVLIGARDEDDTCLSFKVDLAPYEAYNLAFEKPDYIDKDGRATLTARQANQYPKEHLESMWVDENDPIGSVAQLLDDQQTALFSEFVSAGTGVTYTAWLEAQVRQLRSLPH